MKKITSNMIRIISASAAFCCLCGCEDGGSSHDFGDNNPEVAVAMGDSITALEGGNTTTYPAILASMTGKTVINKGSGGAVSGAGASAVSGYLNEYKPGYLLILYGANDVIHSMSKEGTIANLRSMITAAKNNSTVPVIGTLTPMHFSHDIFNGSAMELNVMIRQMAAEEGCAVADLESAFGSNTSYYNSDGLHPNDSGLQVIANAFAGSM